MSRVTSKTFPDYIYKDIKDQYTRETFKRLQDFLENFQLFKGNFKFFEFPFDKAVTDQIVPHGLKFIPTDIIETSQKGPGVLTWDFDKFDRDNLVVTTTGACTVRAFVGAYREE